MQSEGCNRNPTFPRKFTRFFYLFLFHALPARFRRRRNCPAGDVPIAIAPLLGLHGPLCSPTARGANQCERPPRGRKALQVPGVRGHFTDRVRSLGKASRPDFLFQTADMIGWHDGSGWMEQPLEENYRFHWAGWVRRKTSVIWSGGFLGLHVSL